MGERQNLNRDPVQVICRRHLDHFRSPNLKAPFFHLVDFELLNMLQIKAVGHDWLGIHLVVAPCSSMFIQFDLFGANESR